jgi:hypothetical protein
MFVDRLFSSEMHLETYCISCGFRKFFHPPAQSQEGSWLLKVEQTRAKNTIASL